MLHILFGPSLSPLNPPKINTGASWLGLGSLYLAALTSKYFLCHMNVQGYNQGALNICDIGGEFLSGAELINETQGLVANAKWAKEVHSHPGSGDFFAKRVQAYSQMFLSSMEIFSNTVRVGFFLKRLHFISFSSNLQKQLEKINQAFYFFSQTFSLFQKGYQGYLCNKLSHNTCSWAKEELKQKCRLSLLNTAEISTKIFLSVLENASRKLEGSILTLSACLFVLKIILHLYDNQSYKGKWKFSLEGHRFVYGG